VVAPPGLHVAARLPNGHEGTSGFCRSVDEAVRAAQTDARVVAGDEHPGAAAPGKEE
jgi:hypothetical protein